MSGFFGVVSKKDCVLDLFFGTDYHSHLGTKRGGMVVCGEHGFQRSIHNIENAPFRTKFEDDVEEFEGNIGIGCISDTDAQPLLVSSRLGSFAISTVGRINNLEELKQMCFEKGKCQFLEMSRGRLNQTEVVAALINLKDDVAEGIRYAQEQIDGSMSILLLFSDRIVAARDLYGRTPVVIGKKEDAYCATFESCAYLNLGYKHVCDLGPGEVVEIKNDSCTRLKEPIQEMKMCSFLWSYYGYPTATYEGVNVEMMRAKCGSQMRKRDNVEVDAIAGVPDSGLGAAIGYANEAKIPYTRPFIKYTPTWPRSFMPDSQKQRSLIAHMKLIPIHELIANRKLLLIDDSIVRGTQLKETAQFLYNSGAKEVHVRPACPPILFSCKYLNFSRTTNDLDLIGRKVIAEIEGTAYVPQEILDEYANPDHEKHKLMVGKICEIMGFDSLVYHRLDDLIEAIGLNPCKLCTYCFNGKE